MAKGNAQKGGCMTEARTISLTQGQVALVDDADFDWLSKYKWHADWNRYTRTFYASRSVAIRGKSPQKIFMHREILGLHPGDRREGEHREPSRTLDNRRSNLRIATKIENARNRRRRRDNASGHKGVQQRSSGMFRARIRVDGKLINLGTRKTAEEAHELYRQAATVHFGDFARFA